MFAISALLTGCLPKTEAQAPTGSILLVEIENSTLYARGFCNPSDRAKDPNKLPAPSNRQLGTFVGIGDIVSVNGLPVKGTAIEIINAPIISSDFSPGAAIGDFPGGPTATSWDLGFLTPDGTVVGTIALHGQGTLDTVRPPGAPKEITGGSMFSVTGGTGAFFGARGYLQPTQDAVSGERKTSDCEDPAYRRINADAGRNKRHAVLYLVPLSQPQVLSTANGLAVVHADDNTLVTAAKPAKAGEILSLFASGLGPTRPGVGPGQPFTAVPIQVVNSPVQVLVDGSPGEVLYAGGYPGAVDGYQVNFRIPDGTTAGQASLRLTSAWISGPEAKIPIQ